LHNLGSGDQTIPNQDTLSETQSSDQKAPVSYLGILARFVAAYARPTPLLLMLGTLSVIAETLGITLVVLFLYSVMGHSADAVGAGGLLASLFRKVDTLVGGNTAALGILILFALVAKALLNFAYGALTATMRHAVGKMVRRELFRQYMTVSYEYVRRHDDGELVNILTSESDTIAEAYYSLTRIAINVCAVGFFVLFLLTISWEITLIAACGAAAVFLIRRRLGSPARQLGEKATAAKNELTERILNAVQGMRTVRAFAQEALAEERFDKASSLVQRTSVAREHLQNLIPPLSECSYLVVLGVVVIASNVFHIPFASTLAAVALLYRLQPHMRELDTHLLELGGIEASVRLIGTTLEHSDKDYPADGIAPFNGIKEELRFENVTMVYSGSTKPTLCNASFSIPAGRTTAIVGRSGVGKTTVVNLLLRLYEPTSGSILVDGTPITSFEKRSWLSRISVAGQDLELIEGTIAENIAFGVPGAPMEDIEEAAVLAGMMDFVSDLADGFYTWVGERGLNLSAGQRQRVNLARAIIRRPDLLILDEATTALDDALEEEVRRNLLRAQRGRTMIVITHRMDMARTADHIIKLARGRVIEDKTAALDRYVG
jgi:ABC-type multidrug transport system fused ATPase/permease subunit